MGMAAFGTEIMESCHCELDAAQRHLPVPIVQVGPECAMNGPPVSGSYRGSFDKLEPLGEA